MRILQVHNRYRPGWGGEDTVVELEADLLRRNGHDVERLSAWTGELNGASPLRLFSTGLGTVWSFSGYSKMKTAIARFSPDIVHVHNTFPLLSPSIYWAAHRARVPVVQTLHNFRLTCANALLLRKDRPCEECVGRVPLPALRYRCYRESLVQTAAVFSMNVAHRWLGTYASKVDAYIVLTEFSKKIMARAGLPEQRIYVKPNFSPGPGKLTNPRHSRVVFVGEISRPKGVHLLLEAWTHLDPHGYELVVVGDGAIRAELERTYGANGSIVWTGPQSREKVREIVSGSRWLCLPSLAYENFPMTVLEAFSAGTPVIVPDHGCFGSIVSDGTEGLLFRAGDVASLIRSIRRSLEANADAWTQHSENARATFFRKYTDRANYAQLMHVYQSAIDCFGAARTHSTLRRGPQVSSTPVELAARTYDRP